jgi:hypothetical protein
MPSIKPEAGQVSFQQIASLASTGPGAESSSEQLAFQYVFLGISVSYFAFGFEVVTS